MNKFIKHKVRLINAQLKQTFLVHSGGLYEVTYRVSNRQANRILKLVRALPTDFLIKNNPDLEALIWAVKQTSLKDQTLKLNINKQYGAFGNHVAMGEPLPASAPNEITTATEAALNLRKLVKKTLTEEKVAMMKAVHARQAEIITANPQAGKTLKELACLLWNYE